MAKGKTYRLVDADGCRSLCVPLSLWPALTGIISDNEFQFHPDCWIGMVEEVLNMPICGSYGWDGSEWRKLAMLWGYSDRWGEDIGGVKSGDGTYSKYTVAVPAGYVYVVQIITLRNMSGARSTIAFYLRDSVTDLIILRYPAPAQHELITLQAAFVLKEGDQIKVTQDLCLNGDGLQGLVWGYKMKVAE